MASRTFDWKKLLQTPAQKRAEAAAEAEKIAKKEAQAQKRAEAKAKKAEDLAKKNDPKARATALGEPYVAILSMELNPDDPGQGAFELDWNDKFVANLVRAGYQGKTDADIVDNWFQNVCRNVVLETYEQEQADPEQRRTNNRRDLGNGRTEIS